MPDVSLNGIEFVIKGSSDEASESVDKLTEKLNGLKSSLMGVRSVSKFSVAIKSVGDAARSASKPMNNFLASIKRIAFYRMIRTIIKEIADAIREGTENFYNFSKSIGSKLGTFATAIDKTKQAASQMKNQIGAAFGELYQLVVPIILELISYVTQLAEWFSKLFAALRGAEGWWKATAGGISDVGGAAKEAMKYLAPFDELNRLPGNNGGGGGGGTGVTYEWMPFGDDSGWGKIAQFVRENLEALELLVEIFGFTIGVVALLSGHIALGLGLMAYFGYKGIQNITENWGKIKEQLQGTLGGITAVVSGALLVLGAILTFTGANIPLGIGMMVAGAAGLAAVIAANWDEIPNKLRGPLGEATAIISGASLVLGILMLLCGAWPVGLGLIAAGAAGLTATAVANWDNIKEIGKKFVDKIGEGIESASDKINDFVKEYIADPLKNAANKIEVTVEAAVDLVKNGWSTVTTWVKEEAQLGKNAVKKAIALAKDEWTSVSAWVNENIGGAVSKAIGLAKNNWTSVAAWVKKAIGGAVNKDIGLARDDWTSVASWIKDSFLGGAVKKAISISADFVGNATKAVQNFIDKWNALTDKKITIQAVADKFKETWNAIATKWNNSAFLKSIFTLPTLAGGGTLNAGQIFIARESGPEIVGQFGNRTGVMNNQQIVAAVSSGVANAIAGLRFSVSSAPQTAYVNNEQNEETLYRAMLRALNSADRQPIEIDIDGEPVYRGVVNRNRKETFRTGVNPMMSKA